MFSKVTPPLDRLFLSVAETCEVLGCGRTRFYRKVQDGDLPIVKDGRKTLVPVSAVKKYAERQVAQQAAA